MPRERKYRFLEVYLTKESRTLGILSSLLGADRTKYLMLSSSLTTYQDLNLTHSCSAGSGRKNSFHLELEMQFVQCVQIFAICAIRATVLTFKQEELEK